MIQNLLRAGVYIDYYLSIPLIFDEYFFSLEALVFFCIHNLSFALVQHTRFGSNFTFQSLEFWITWSGIICFAYLFIGGQILCGFYC